MMKHHVLSLSGYVRGWTKLPPISALRQPSALQQNSVSQSPNAKQEGLLTLGS